ncbi:hypothetical protein ACIRP3_43735 [Streptomyces sp. NPDC101209]|uniref:hypothetical protein n=1 Tax=Streptomyces sp. NPDC101209 TaxID=3366129 RepID=UPI0037FFB19F
MTIVPLLMLDLDNTLVDRDAAFRDAIAEIETAHGLPHSDLAWIREPGSPPQQSILFQRDLGAGVGQEARRLRAAVPQRLHGDVVLRGPCGGRRRYRAGSSCTGA